MATSLWQLLKEYRVIIPLIQRDYAQGREIGKAPLVRDKFLNALCSTIQARKDPLELDFVYGYIMEPVHESGKSDKVFIPLDGQQRLTTLFLLHWYIAATENHLMEAESFLAKFTYETRHSSRVFCNQLVTFKPDKSTVPIKEVIVNQPWFFTAWKNDPTVSSMLTMLNAIQEKVRNNDIRNVWPALTSENPLIAFHLLPMEKLGLPDDLYIKMNSRGKELTEFEYFKSRFHEILSNENAGIFNSRIDNTWSDLFWGLYRNTENIDIAKLVDNGFLRFFRYVTDVLISFTNVETGDDLDDFSRVKTVYESSENVEFLFSCLNVLSETRQQNPNFFNSIFYIQENDFDESKTRLFFQSPETNLLYKCCNSYDATQRINSFSIGEQLLLYACLIHLTNETTDFVSQVRIVRNLIANSEDTLRKENMQFLLDSVSEIVLNNVIEENSKFSKIQIDEEITKQEFIKAHPASKHIIFQLEDHELLRGCLAVFKLDSDLDKYAHTFIRTFTSDANYVEISRALLTFSDYSQRYSFYNRLAVSNTIWREFFTRSQRRTGFEKTQDAIYSLFTHLINNPELNIEDISLVYLDSFDLQLQQPKDWKYYYIRYKEFREQNSDGYYYWENDSLQYECIMMRRSQRNGKHWSPFLLTLYNNLPGQLNLDEYGSPLVLVVVGNKSIKLYNVNQGFRVEATDESSASITRTLQLIGLIDSDCISRVQQDENGIDLEDRIQKGKELIARIREVPLYRTSF